MKLSTQVVPIEATKGLTIADAISKELTEIQRVGCAVLRWGLVKLDGKRAFLEVAKISGVPQHEIIPMQHRAHIKHPGVHIALIIPTGVGASIGGFIGDAGPLAKAFGTVADTVILHPNVVNAADFYAGSPKSFYVDGLTLDLFFAGHIRLGAQNHRKIGLILDKLDVAAEARLLNSANAARAVSGLDIINYVICDEKVQSYIHKSEYGHFVSEIENVEVLFGAAETLQRQGANAIAVVTAIAGVRKDYLDSHYRGVGPNPIGSAEALISRAITWKTGLPCAHAPAFIEGLGQSITVVDPRAAAEVSSGSGLPCVLYGLNQAPEKVENEGIGVSDLSAIIVPFECAGGAPALLTRRFGVPLLAVKSNHCMVGVHADVLNLTMLTVVENYAEAVAFVACKRAGVTWESIQRPLGYIQHVMAGPTEFSNREAGVPSFDRTPGAL